MKPTDASEQTIFDAARQMADAPARAAYLESACSGNPKLRGRIEELLNANKRADEFLGTDPLELGQAGRQTTTLVILSEAPGTVIDKYKLLEKIGEGGFGVVYMAEQKQPVKRRVALKIIKIGMDTREVVARFEAERQALAMMDHPSIAKVFDAGATETGRTYFVMELVRGIKITQYCDQKSLSTRERLDLFIKVCQAVQHAHQKGIVHRDLKPSNILATVNDGVAVPKIIDFGIAKATQMELTEKTVFTRFQQFIGTPAYMSPEQAEITSVDIDTRSDIYSLGVLLYELLTGQTPFDAKELLQVGLEEMRRTICEQEPQRPSTRVSTLGGEELTTTAKRRGLDAPRLANVLRGDLDWIVMKCLEKDRARRYETANGLAADLKRHLENEPIIARPPTTVYRLQKAWHRNRVVFAGAALIAIVLVVATGISARQAVRATRAETLAKQRLAESEEISKFMTGVFQSPEPTRDGLTITVAETLDRAAKKVETDLANQPHRRAAVQATLAGTYHALGLDRQAIPLWERVREYCLAVHGPEHSETIAAMEGLASSYEGTGRRDEALKLFEEGLTIRRKVLGPENPDTLSAMDDLAFSYSRAGRLEEALKLHEETLKISRKVNGPEHPETLRVMNNLAGSYQEVGRRDEAIKLHEEVLRLRRKVLGPEDSYTLHAMVNLAGSYQEAGRLGEAIKLREEALRLSRKVNGPEHPDTLWAMGNLAMSYNGAGRREEALKLREEALRIFRKVSGPENPSTRNAMDEVASSYHDAGRLGEELKVLGELLELQRKALGPEHPDTSLTLQHLADAYFSVGRNKEAFALLVKACDVNPKNTDASLTLATWQTWSGQDADYEATRRRLVEQAEGTDADRMHRAAKAYCLRPSADAALLAKACNLAQQSVELAKKTGDPSLPWYQEGLGMAEYRSGHYAAAERALTIVEKTVGADPKLQGSALLYRAMNLSGQNRSEEALKLFRQAEAQMPPLPQDGQKPLLEGKLVDHDYLIWWLAYKEVKTLLNDSGAAKP